MSTHNLETLFQQLGLSGRAADIEHFVTAHKLPMSGSRLADAGFWTPSQAAFLREAFEQDSDWCEVVDELDRLLRG